MANCDKDPCDCPVCLDNKNLLRLECNGPRGTHHYLCRDCLMKLQQFTPPEPDSFPFQPPHHIRWKICPTCRGPIKRASRYNVLLRHPAGETAQERQRRQADPEAHRGYLPETDLQDEEFAREQYLERIAPLAQSLIDLDNANRRSLVAEAELAQVQAQVDAHAEAINQNNNSQRIAGIAWLIVAAGIIVYSFVSTTMISTSVGGGTTDRMETNQKIQEAKGLGAIYIGRSEGTFGLWWSVVLPDGFPLNIRINNKKQYKELLEKYGFTTKQDFDIDDELDKVSKLNQQNSVDTKNVVTGGGETGGSRKKRRRKQRVSRRKK